MRQATSSADEWRNIPVLMHRCSSSGYYWQSETYLFGNIAQNGQSNAHTSTFTSQLPQQSDGTNGRFCEPTACASQATVIITIIIAADRGLDCENLARRKGKELKRERLLDFERSYGLGIPCRGQSASAGCYCTICDSFIIIRDRSLMIFKQSP